MIMATTACVERRSATRATIIAFKVLGDRHFYATRAAQNGAAIEFIFAPRPDGVSRFLIMTLVTWVVFLAAPEFYRHHIHLGMVVYAPGLIVHRLTPEERKRLLLHDLFLAACGAR
jgi:hypothetical protein